MVVWLVADNQYVRTCMPLNQWRVLGHNRSDIYLGRIGPSWAEIPVVYEPTVNYQMVRDLQWSMSLYTPPTALVMVTGS
jgi:hypothetical protein